MTRPTLTATVYDKRGRQLAKENNSYTQTHPVQYKYANAVGEPTRIYLHAEIAALVKAIKNGKPYKLTVERYDRRGLSKCAKPCAACERAIKAFGVKRVEYTT